MLIVQIWLTFNTIEKDEDLVLLKKIFGLPGQTRLYIR